MPLEESTALSLDPHEGDLPNVAGAPLAGQKPDITVTEDGNQVKVGDKTYVRHEALVNERAEKQQLLDTLNKLAPHIDRFSTFMEREAQRENATLDRTTADDIEGDYTEDDLKGLALVRGYYEADGVTPDTKRAQQELNLLGRISDRSAQRHVKPVADISTAERARNNYQAAISEKFIDGEPLADQQYMEAALKTMPAEYLADANVANIVKVVAVGLQALDERRTGKTRRVRSGEPTFREGSSARPGAATEESLGAFERAAARARGKSPDEWAKMSKALDQPTVTGSILDSVE